MSSLPKGDLRHLSLDLLEPRIACGDNYVPHIPHPKQAAFLNLTTREALFGGAAGGGKTDALLMGALQYVCIPGYSALMLRETHPQLVQDEGLIPRAHEWLGGTDAEWSAGLSRWTFPSGATISFGHIEREDMRYKFAGGAWQYIAWDELVNWRNDIPYTFLFSRLRKPKQHDDLKACPSCGLTVADIPLRVRAGTNPGSRGAAWVYDRFIGPWRDWRIDGAAKPHRIFVPSRLSDNPSMDAEEYALSLAELDPITRAQLLDGDWDVRTTGGMFMLEWFKYVADFPRGARLCRFWDLAATEPKPGRKPDWTVGALVGLHEGRWYIIDVKRAQLTPRGVEQLILNTSDEDEANYGSVAIRMEQEPGSSGKTVIDHYARNVLVGKNFKGVRSTGSKTDRAVPVAVAAEAENLFIVAAEWNKVWVQEHVLFPLGPHDDQVDAGSGGVNELSQRRKRARLVL